MFDIDYVEKLISVAEKARLYPNLKHIHDEVMKRLEQYRSENEPPAQTPVAKAFDFPAVTKNPSGDENVS